MIISFSDGKRKVCCTRDDPYIEAIEIFKEASERRFSDSLRAVLVMGNVARNEHVQGRCDIDTVCVLGKERTDIQRIAVILESFDGTIKGK